MTVEQAQALLDELLLEERQIQVNYEARMADLKEKIAAVQTTIELLSEGKLETLERSTTAWVRLLKGTTHKEALVRIARANGGTLRLSQAKRIFLAAGLTVLKPRSLNAHLYHNVTDMPEFAWESPGVFRLVTDEEAKYFNAAHQR